MTDVFVDGREAERLVKDPTLTKALERIEQKTTERWRLAKSAAEREECHATMRAVDAVRVELQAMIGNKRMAEEREKTFGKSKR